MRAFSSVAHRRLIRRHEAGVVSSTDLPRIASTLILLAILVTGIVLGGAVLTNGAGATPSPSATPSPWGASPTPRSLPVGDVEGEDLARLPRYPGSVKTQFEVAIDDRYRLTLTEYLASASVDEVRAFYQGVILDHGWERADVAYSGGEWTYVLVDGPVEALIEIEMTDGLVEIDLQLSEPIETPTPRPTVPPTAAPTPTPAAPPPDDDDDGGGDDDSEDDDGSDD
jgi:hypothetical protein